MSIAVRFEREIAAAFAFIAGITKPVLNTKL